jgi:chitodextrinase
MWKAASRCIFRRALLALLALGAFAVTLQAPAGDAASKKLPSGTSSITVTQATETSLSISWQRARRAGGYDVYLNRTRVATTQTTAYTLAGLRCGSTYEVGVDAFNARGVRSSILSVAGSTSACPGTPVGNDTSPPTSPVSLIQGATTTTSISLLWAASLDNVGVAGYELFLNGNKVGTTSATTYTFTNLSCGTSYALAVDAFDAAGNRSQSAVVQASASPCPDTCSPTIPALPTQSGSTATSISLLWSASLDNVGVAGYDLFVNGNKVGTTTATTYTFTNLSCGTSYALAVDAFDAAGNRSQSAVVQASASPCPDTSSPTIPALPTQTGSTATSISLLWSASLDNVGVAGYELFLNGNKVGTTAATSYTFPNLSCGTSYALAVDAFDAAGNRSQRSSLNGTTSTCASVAPSPQPNNCTATLAAGGNYAAFVNGLSPGEIGCVHGGTYGCDPNSTTCYVHITASGTAASPITVKSYPGETATVRGFEGIDGSYLTFTGMRFDGANSSASVNSCGGQPHGVGLMVGGTGNVFDHVEVFSSIWHYMASAFYLQGNNATIRYSKIHDWGTCPGHDHGVYDHDGSGAQIHHNWFYETVTEARGWGVQLYPSSSNAHVYANVIDRAGSGVVNCSTGTNNVIENNVVTNSQGTAFTSGALIDGCGPQGSTGHIVRNNDQWQNPGGLGSCNSTVTGEVCSGNLSSNPLFVDPSAHNYALQPGSPLAGYGLWNGS